MSYKTKIGLTLLSCFCIGIIGYDLSTKNLNKMVGQMIMTGFHGDGTDPNDINYMAIKEQITKGHIGGVILFDVDVAGLKTQGIEGQEAKKYIFSGNIKNMSQVKNMISDLQSLTSTPLFVAVDQEGGKVQRLKLEHGFISIPSAKELASTDTKKTYQTAYDLGLNLKSLGINLDFAPCVDVNVNLDSPIISGLDRSFSPDPTIVTKFGGAFAHGLNDAGVISVYKHFPGHGSANGDSHEGITDVTNTYQNYELQPYQELLQNKSGCYMVMVAHIINKNIDFLPASLSQKTIQILRDKGFNGVVVSDDMDMGAIVKQYGREKAIELAINAGNDMLIFGNNLDFDANKGTEIHKTIIKLIHEGKIKKSDIRKSYHRIKRAKKFIHQNRK